MTQFAMNLNDNHSNGIPTEGKTAGMMRLDGALSPKEAIQVMGKPEPKTKIVSITGDVIHFARPYGFKGENDWRQIPANEIESYKLLGHSIGLKMPGSNKLVQLCGARKVTERKPAAPKGDYKIGGLWINNLKTYRLQYAKGKNSTKFTIPVNGDALLAKIDALRKDQKSYRSFILIDGESITPLTNGDIDVAIKGQTSGLAGLTVPSIVNPFVGASESFNLIVMFSHERDYTWLSIVANGIELNHDKLSAEASLTTILGDTWRRDSYAAFGVNLAYSQRSQDHAGNPKTSALVAQRAGNWLLPKIVSATDIAKFFAQFPKVTVEVKDGNAPSQDDPSATNNPAPFVQPVLSQEEKELSDFRAAQKRRKDHAYDGFGATPQPVNPAPSPSAVNPAIISITVEAMMKSGASGAEIADAVRRMMS